MTVYCTCPSVHTSRSSITNANLTSQIQDLPTQSDAQAVMENFINCQGARLTFRAIALSCRIKHNNVKIAVNSAGPVNQQQHLHFFRPRAFLPGFPFGAGSSSEDDMLYPNLARSVFLSFLASAFSASCFWQRRATRPETAAFSFSHQPAQRSKFSYAFAEDACSLALQMSGVVMTQPQRW